MVFMTGKALGGGNARTYMPVLPGLPVRGPDLAFQCRRLSWFGRWRWGVTHDYRVYVGIFGKPWVDDWYSLSEDGWLTLRRGFRWDGATGGLDTATIRRGSAVHDALCRMMAIGVLPRSLWGKCGAIFRRINEEDGMCSVRAWWTYRAVVLWGRVKGYRDTMAYYDE